MGDFREGSLKGAGPAGSARFVLALFSCCQESQMVADGQVAILDREVTPREEPCRGADRSHYAGRGPPALGTLSPDRDTVLV